MPNFVELGVAITGHLFQPKLISASEFSHDLSMIPFTDTRRCAPKLTEANLYTALKVAFPTVTDVKLLSKVSFEFFGSNIEFQRCAISSGVHPALLIECGGSGGDHVTLGISFGGTASIKTAAGDRVSVNHAEAVLAFTTTWSLESSDYKGLVVRVPRTELMEHLSLLQDKEVELEHATVLPASGNSGVAFVESLRSLQSYCGTESLASGVHDNFLVSALALFVAGNPSTPLEPAHDRMRAVFTRACTAIAGNLTSDLTVVELARSLGVSVRYLQMSFQANSRSSPKQWMLSAKLDQARADLALDGRCTVVKAAERYGFSSPSHFSAAFKRKFGVSPSALRG